MSGYCIGRRLLFALLLTSALGVSWARAATVTLTNEQRRQHLQYYAPLIMKQAAEADPKLWGADWITNFDYDSDGDFSTNRSHWINLVGKFAANPSAAEVADWRIRPTLYSALLEFENNGVKTLILLYHVYHAMEDGSVHDWERIEIRIDGAKSTPGGTEAVRYVTITNHKRHMARRPESLEVRFMQLGGTGMHPIIYQGQWKDVDDEPRKNELRFVVTSWADIDKAKKCSVGNCTATVDVIDGEGKRSSQPVHYVFVPGGSATGVDYWKSEYLSPTNATRKAAKTDKPFSNWSLVRSVNYGLQDLADILPTHADSASCGVNAVEHNWGHYPVHWVSKGEDAETVKIWMESSIWSESQTKLVPTSAFCSNRSIVFYRNSKDGGKVDGAQGYPHKHWFWGAYVTGVEDGNATDDAFNGDGFRSPGSNVEKKRLCPEGIKKEYWCQHDYYLHTGNYTSQFSASKMIDDGHWLKEGWYKAVNGGFDGRWVQLFAD